MNRTAIHSLAAFALIVGLPSIARAQTMGPCGPGQTSSYDQTFPTNGTDSCDPEYYPPEICCPSGTIPCTTTGYGPWRAVSVTTTSPWQTYVVFPSGGGFANQGTQNLCCGGTASGSYSTGTQGSDQVQYTLSGTVGVQESVGVEAGIAEFVKVQAQVQVSAAFTAGKTTASTVTQTVNRTYSFSWPTNQYTYYQVQVLSQQNWAGIVNLTRDETVYALCANQGTGCPSIAANDPRWKNFGLCGSQQDSLTKASGTTHGLEYWQFNGGVVSCGSCPNGSIPLPAGCTQTTPKVACPTPPDGGVP
jgi:hypothetical protein